MSQFRNTSSVFAEHSLATATSLRKFDHVVSASRFRYGNSGGGIRTRLKRWFS
jgi:hypothetical protein